MRLIKNTTELIGIKDPNIIISLVFEKDTYIEVQATLDYPAPPCPHCQGKMIKYDFQKPSKIPLLEQAGTPTLLRLKKRRFQCKSCRRVTVAETATWPKYNYYRADEKYQDIARMLGLPASTPEEGVESYAKAVYELGERIGIQMNFRDQGIDEKEWKEHSRELAFLAYEDQCSPANPRLPMVDICKKSSKMHTMATKKDQDAVNNCLSV